MALSQNMEKFTIEQIGQRAIDRAGGKLDSYNATEVGKRIYDRHPDKFKGLIAEPAQEKSVSGFSGEGIDPALKAQLEKRGMTDKINELEKGASEATTAKQFIPAVNDEFVAPAVRGVVRPFYETKGSIEALTPGGKTGLEPANLGPFGELKPTGSFEATKRGINEKPQELAGEALGVAQFLPGTAELKGVGRRGLEGAVDKFIAEKGTPSVNSLGTKIKQSTQGILNEKLNPALRNRAINREEKLAEKELFRNAPAEIQDAVGKGIEMRDANNLRASLENPQLATKANEMLAESKKLIGGNRNADPALVVGEAALKKFNTIETAKNAVGKKLGEYAKAIPSEKLQNTNITILNRLKEVRGLEGIKMKLTREGWALDFSNTTMSRNKSAQREIVNAFRDATKRDAKGQHLLRQELFDELQLKDAKKVKQIKTTPDKAIEAVRQGLSDVLDNANDQYKLLNAQYRFLENSLKSSRRVLGNSLSAGEKIKAGKFAQVVRRTTGNANADALTVLEDLQNALKAINLDDGLNLQELQSLLDIFDKYFDIAKRAGFQGQIQAGVEKAIPSSIKGALYDISKKGVKSVIGETGATGATKERAIEDLINSAIKRK